MNNNTNIDGVKPRIRWNDIRFVGPFLVLALMAALMISPNLDGAARSIGDAAPCPEDNPEFMVGAGGLPCDCPGAPVTAIGATAPCPTTPVPTVMPTPAPSVTPAPGPTVAPTNAARVVFLPEVEVMGPTWLGPIVPTVNGDSVTLKFPVLLSVFIGEKHFMKITTDSGRLVYSGQLPTNRTITVPHRDAASLVVKSPLVSHANYTEIVPLAYS